MMGQPVRLSIEGAVREHAHVRSQGERVRALGRAGRNKVGDTSHARSSRFGLLSAVALEGVHASPFRRLTLVERSVKHEMCHRSARTQTSVWLCRPGATTCSVICLNATLGSGYCNSFAASV